MAKIIQNGQVVFDSGVTTGPSGPRLVITRPVGGVSDGFLVLTDTGSVTTQGMDGLLVTPTYSLKLPGASTAIDWDGEPYPVDASLNGSAIITIAGEADFGGVRYMIEDDADPVTIAIAAPTGKPPTLKTQPTVSYTSLKVDSTVTRVAPEWDASAELRFARGWAYPNVATTPAFLPVQSTDPAATIAGLLPTGWTLLTDTTVTLKLPTTLVDKAGFVYLSLKGNADGATLACSPIYGPVEAAASVVSLFDGVEGLSSPAVTGAPSGTKKNPASDTLPTNVTSSGKTITVPASAGDFFGWDTRGWMVQANSSARIADNLMGEMPLAPGGQSYALQIGATAHGLIVEDNTFEGPGTFTVQGAMINTSVTNLTLATAVGPHDVTVQDNQFLKVAQDVMKLWGDATMVRRNYSDQPVNYPAGTALYDPGKVYNISETSLGYCFNANGDLFQSAVANNSGVAPPTSATSNARWTSRAPHCDWATVTGVTAGGLLTISRNLVDWRGGKAIGVNNVIRISPNANTCPPLGAVLVEGNEWVGPHGGYFPIDVGHDAKWGKGDRVFAKDAFLYWNDRIFVALVVANAGESPTSHPAKWALVHDTGRPGPFIFRHNKMGRGSDGGLFRPDATWAHIVWDNNVDQQSGAALAPRDGSVVVSTTQPKFADATAAVAAITAYGPSAAFDITVTAYGSVRYGGAYVEAAVLKVDDQVVGHIPKTGSPVAYANSGVTMAAGTGGVVRLTLLDASGSGTMQGRLRIVGGAATVALASATVTSLAIELGPNQSNFKYPLNTTKQDPWNHPAMDSFRPTLDDETQAVLFGRQDVDLDKTPKDSRLYSMAINNSNGRRTSTHANGCVPLAIMLTTQWFQKKATWAAIKLKFYDACRSGIGPGPLLDNDNLAWMVQDVKDVVALGGQEPDIIITKWVWPFTKKRYLRVQDAVAPAAALALPGSDGQDESFFDVNATTGTKDSTPAPLFSTKTALAVVPEPDANLRADLRTMMADADWQKIIQQKFIGRWDGIAATGGHPFSNILSGHALWAHKIIWPHIAAYMFRKGLHPTDIFEPGQQQFVTYSDGNTKAHVHISLVNGGPLQLPRTVWGVANAGTPFEAMQPCLGMFIQRAGEADSAIGPVTRLGSSGAANHQGTVTLETARTQIASVTLANGTVVTNGWWGIVCIEVPAAQKFNPSDRIHTFRNWWPLTSIGDIYSEPNGPEQEPLLDLPTEGVPHLNFPGLILPFAGLDIAMYHPPHIVPDLNAVTSGVQFVGWTGNSLTALEGGSASVPQPGDYEVAFFSTAHQNNINRTLTPGADAGYTLLGEDVSTDAHRMRIAVYGRRYGATLPTSIEITTSATNSQEFNFRGAMVFRNVHATTPLDVAVVKAKAIDGALANPPSLTTVTAGTAVVAIGAAALEKHDVASPFSTTVAASSTHKVFSQAGKTTVRGNATIMEAFLGWTAGAVDPAALVNPGSADTDSWVAFTLALRPAS